MIVTVCNCCQQCCCQCEDKEKITNIETKATKINSVDEELQKLLEREIDTDATKSILLKMNPQLCRYIKCPERKIVEVRKETQINVQNKQEREAMQVETRQVESEESKRPKRTKIEKIDYGMARPRDEHKVIGFYREYQRMPRYSRQIIRYDSSPRIPVVINPPMKQEVIETGVNTDVVPKTARIVELRNIEVQTQKQQIKRQKTEESEERQTKKKREEPREVRQTQPTRYPKPPEPIRETPKPPESPREPRETPKPPKPVIKSKKPPTPPQKPPTPPPPPRQQIRPPQQEPTRYIQQPPSHNLQCQHHCCYNCQHYNCQKMRQMKMEILNKAYEDPRLAQRLVGAARSNNIYKNYAYQLQGMNSCTCPHPNCGHYYCLPRHELNPKNYSCGASECINRIPYAGVGRLNCPAHKHYNCYCYQ